MNVTQEELNALILRISRIEAFLDAELRERQHLAQLRGDGSSGPINPWYGCGLGFDVQPVDISPVGSERPCWVAKSGIGDV